MGSVNPVRRQSCSAALRRLTALEADKIRLEHEDLVAKIADYQDILAGVSGYSA